MALEKGNMKSKSTIERKGVVLSVNDGIAQVEIECMSACSACHAKSLCSSSEKQNKIVDAYVDKGSQLAVGENVIVEGRESMGIVAVVVAYLLPLIIMVLVLSLMVMNGCSDGIAGLVSLGVLIPYYLVLYMVRDKLYNKFIFKTKKQIII